MGTIGIAVLLPKGGTKMQTGDSFYSKSHPAVTFTVTEFGPYVVRAESAERNLFMTRWQFDAMINHRIFVPVSRKTIEFSEVLAKHGGDYDATFNELMTLSEDDPLEVLNLPTETRIAFAQYAFRRVLNDPLESTDQLYCAECETPIERGDKFCGGCGGALNWEPI